MEVTEKEHFQNVRLYQVDKLAIAIHFWGEGHNISNGKAKLSN